VNNHTIHGVSRQAVSSGKVQSTSLLLGRKVTLLFWHSLVNHRTM